MSLDAMFAVLALLIAVYAIMPRTSKLDLKIRLNRFDYVIAIFLVVCANVLLFLSFPLESYIRLTTGEAAYLITAGSLAFLWYRYTRGKLKENKIPQLHDLLVTLRENGQFAEVIYLLERNLNQLNVFRESGNREAEGIFGTVLQSRKTAETVANSRPYFALELLDKKIWREKFLQIYIQTLMSDRDSIWYSELNRDYTVESNRFLPFFLDDVNKAKEYKIWKPVINEVLRQLREFRQSPETDPYNSDVEGYKSEGGESGSEWECPIFTAIEFFDTMIIASLDQKNTFHFFLWNWIYVVDNIVGNCRYDSDREKREEVELLTRYCYLLYRIVNTIAEWTIRVRNICGENPALCMEQESEKTKHLRIQDVTSLAVGNIPKTCIWTLGQCLHEILRAENVPDNTKELIATCVFDTYFELRTCTGTEKHAELLRMAMKQERFSPSTDEEFRCIVLYWLEVIYTIPRQYDLFLDGHNLVQELKDFLRT